MATELTVQKCAVTKQILENKYAEKKLEQMAKIRLSQKQVEETSYQSMIKQRRFVKEYTKVATIGRGAFGEVRLVKDKTGKVFAMKIMKKAEMLKKQQIAHVRSERDILSLSQDNPWMVQLECSFQDDKNLYLVMDYMPGGDMMTWLIKKEFFSEEEARFYLAEIVLAVHSIHQLDYVHRDLKPDNILLTGDGHIKLSDFGLSKPYSSQEPDEDVENLLKIASESKIDTKKTRKSKTKKEREKMWEIVGSNGYIAPEVLLKQGYDHTCDWWSVGCIMFEMICGYAPFTDVNNDPLQTSLNIVKWKEYLEFPDDIEISDTAMDLIQKFLCGPNERIKKLKDIKKHPFFKGINWDHIQSAQAPFIPNLRDEFDHSYFDEFEDDDDIDKEISTENKQHRNLFADENRVFFQFTFNKTDTKKKPAKNLHQIFSDE